MMTHTPLSPRPPHVRARHPNGAPAAHADDTRADDDTGAADHALGAQAAADYARVAKAIQYLAEHRLDQPSLDELARVIGLSKFHLQRLFLRWAGVSPKRFVKFLTKEHARRLLASGKSVLGTAFEVGLSGPGRLHDLMVTTEGMTPGEIKARGQGLTLTWGVHATRFGDLALALTPRGVCSVAFLDADAPRESFAESLRRDFPRAQQTYDAAATASVATRILGGADSDGARTPVHVLLSGSPFQIQVWQALVHLPPGEVTSYGALAHAIGKPRATRALASAVAANRLALVIPCHRVIQALGEPGGYRWNPVRKQAILAWEAAQAEPEGSESRDTPL